MALVYFSLLIAGSFFAGASDGFAENGHSQVKDVMLQDRGMIAAQ